jgi:hypothetical protein
VHQQKINVYCPFTKFIWIPNQCCGSGFSVYKVKDPVFDYNILTKSQSKFSKNHEPIKGKYRFKVLDLKKVTYGLSWSI